MSDTSLSRAQDDEPFDLEREPLDREPLAGHDWGGDGSDLSRTVRAHVLAALRPNSAPYPPPLDALLTLGDPRNEGVEERCRALPLTQEHLPDLLRMARDRGLYTADSDTDEVWASLHALHALDGLDLSAVMPELISLLDLDDDQLAIELPELLGKIGAPALEPIRAYLADRTRWAYGHWHASDALEKMAEQHPELREQVVAALGDVLRDAEHYHEISNTAAMGALVELRAVEALPLIRHAFEVGRVDEMIRGSWGDILDDLDVEPEEDDPLLAESERRFEERRERFFPREEREQLLEALDLLSELERQRSLEAEPASASLPAPRASQHLFDEEPTSTPQPAPRASQRTAQEKARKHKNKRKMESASRKANRRKRK